jgi:WXG100 family type VII secretion target
MTIRIEVPEFHASVAEVRRTVAELTSASARAEGQVDLLLHEWHGAAASAFAEAWERWLEASRSVTEGLTSIADGLDGFQTDVIARDASVAVALDQLEARLS